MELKHMLESYFMLLGLFHVKLINLVKLRNNKRLKCLLLKFEFHEWKTTIQKKKYLVNAWTLI